MSDDIKSFVGEIDSSIDMVTARVLENIREDRSRAEQHYIELISLFNQGKNSPDDIRELNKAQELLQSTTDQMQKLLQTLAKVKTGSDKIQVAQISGTTPPEIEFSKEDLIKMIESTRLNLPTPQDKAVTEELVHASARVSP